MICKLSDPIRYTVRPVILGQNSLRPKPSCPRWGTLYGNLDLSSRTSNTTIQKGCTLSGICSVIWWYFDILGYYPSDLVLPCRSWLLSSFLWTRILRLLPPSDIQRKYDFNYRPCLPALILVIASNSIHWQIERLLIWAVMSSSRAMLSLKGPIRSTQTSMHLPIPIYYPQQH